VSRKRPLHRDSRADPLPEGTPAEDVPDYRVDRVFAPLPRTRTITPRPPAAPSTPPVPAGSNDGARETRARRTHKTLPPPNRTIPPATTDEDEPSTIASAPATGGAGEIELELALRRQLSRLQRQLAEAQRELANKDDEVALEIEKRLLDQAAYDTLKDSYRKLELELEDHHAQYDELAQRCDRERELTAAAHARVDELTRSFEEARARWDTEQQALEERAATSREADERALADLRHELETKEVELRGAREELTKRTEAHRAELARLIADRDLQVLGLQQLVRSAEAKERALEGTAADLRASTLALERQLAEARERAAELEADVESLDSRLSLATATIDSLREDQRALRAQLEESQVEARRNALDRTRFVAYLEDGLAMLGALAPEVTIEADEPPEDEAGVREDPATA